MAQTIATISICLFIVLTQHLYNYMFRILFNKMQWSESLFIALTILMVMITCLSFRLLILINK